jgi:hypothetical protein
MADSYQLFGETYYRYLYGEYGGRIFFRNVGTYPIDYMTSHHISIVTAVSTTDPGPDLRLWGPRSTQNVVAPIRNNRFRL